MSQTIRRRSRITLFAAILSLSMPLGLGCGGAAWGQDDGSNRAQDLQDFVHYVNIAKPDLATSHLRRLLDSGISDAELRELIDETVTDARFAEAVARARLIEGMGNIIGELESRARLGALDLARDPSRLADAITMLGGHLRQQQFGRDILMKAGEYAVPWLLKEVTDGKDNTLRLRSLDMLKEIGSVGVVPLSVALSSLDSQNQIRIAGVLGQIGNSKAGPFLAALAADTTAAAASRDAARRAASAVSAGSGSLADEFSTLARRFLTQPGSMLNYPADENNPIWTYDAFAGLVAVGVPTPIYNEVMAMQMARKALQYDPTNATALSIFIAANLKRENDLAADVTDPIYGNSQYSPELYAMGAGPDIMQNVLSIGLEMKDAGVIRDAIASLQKTAGNTNILSTQTGGAPILDALQYPDRRVRYDAALAIGKALPTRSFDGDFRVVPTLAEAVRAGAAAYAVVVAGTKEDQDTYADWLTRKGFQVTAAVNSLAEAQMVISQSSGVDVVVIRQDAGATRRSVSELARSPKTAVAPVVIFASQVDQGPLEAEYRDNPRIQVKVAPREEGVFGTIVDDALARAGGGPMNEGDALAYSLEAIGTLHSISNSSSPVFNINDAETTLIEALESKEGSLATRIASILAFVDSDRAQRAMFDAAFRGTGSDQVDLLNQVAESAKRIGDRAEERHVQQLLGLIAAGGDAGEAAARVHGALNLTPDNVVKLIADN
ncbi:MAG: hypothetical protein ACR2GY_05995 [Phycisphaerales bacterium]